MVKLVALDSNIHRKTGVYVDNVAAALANERTIPVALSEFRKVAIQNPIVFTKNSTTGKFVPVAILGFEPGENLCMENNKWMGFYTPLNISRLPFFIGKDESNDAEYTVCIDIHSSAIVDDAAGANVERIFDDDGVGTGYFDNIRDVLSALLHDEQRATQFISTLLDLDLIMPMQLDVKLEDQPSQQFDGIYTIDEQKLDAASDATIAQLHSLGFLKPIYTMIGSLEHIAILVNKKNRASIKGAAKIEDISRPVI